MYSQYTHTNTHTCRPTFRLCSPSCSSVSVRGPNVLTLTQIYCCCRSPIELHSKSQWNVFLCMLWGAQGTLCPRRGPLRVGEVGGRGGSDALPHAHVNHPVKASCSEAWCYLTNIYKCIKILFTI